jgi:pimeloyl-ACP methyl ester carboxylesterase
MSTVTEAAIRPEVRKIGGLDIRIAMSAQDAGQDAEALLLCPWPESLYAFEPTWRALAGQARLIAVDLPGFGHSERRNELLTPRAMGDFILRLADELELERPHVVGPDVGTAAALFAAATAPGRLRSLVIGSGAVAVPLQLGPPLKDRVEAASLDAFRGIDGREAVKPAISRHERYQLSDVAREDYLSAYAGDRFVESMRYVRSYPQELPILAARLGEIHTPVKLIWGARDPVVPLVNAEFLLARLPHAELAALDATHFVWEDAADDYAREVADWWRRT